MHCYRHRIPDAQIQMENLKSNTVLGVERRINSSNGELHEPTQSSRGKTRCKSLLVLRMDQGKHHGRRISHD